MKRFAYLAAVFAGMWLMAAPLLAQAQESESRPDTGIIYGGQYVNSYFGFSYRFPAAWSANAGRLTMASRIYPLFSATPSGGGDGRFVVIQAEQLRQNDNVRTGRDFLSMSIGMLTGPSTGFEAIPGDKRYTISGKEFDRIDLRSKAAPGAAMVRQALVATVVRDYAVTFQFKASSDYELEDLVNTLQSLSFLDSVQTAASPAAAMVGRTAPQPATSATMNPVAAAPAPAVSSPVRVASQSAPQVAAQLTPQTGPQAVTVSHPANIAPVVSAAPRPTVQPEAASVPAAVAPPSTLIKMASAPHTIPGETLPPTQLEPAPQPLTKMPPKSDPTTKTAVLQAVMPAPSAVLSPAVLNTSTTSATQPPASARLSVPAQAVSTPAVPAQVVPAQAVPAPPAPVQSTAPARKPAYTTQTEITRVQISGEELEGYVIHKAPAMYPALARQARIEGLVVLSIVVDEKGNVQDVRAISGPALLARSAEDALRHWRFKPIIVDGKPTQVESKVSMNFQFAH